MEELYQLGYELSQDHKNIRDKMLYLSRKREKYRLMDDKKNYDLVTKEILDTHDQ